MKIRAAVAFLSAALLLLSIIAISFRTSSIKTMTNPIVPVALDSDFSLHNIPYGVIVVGKEHHMATRLGDSVIDLHACAKLGLFKGKRYYREDYSMFPYCPL